MDFVSTVEPLNEGHFGDNTNSADLFFAQRFSSLRGSKCMIIVGVILRPYFCRNFKVNSIYCVLMWEGPLSGVSLLYTVHTVHT